MPSTTARMESTLDTRLTTNSTISGDCRLLQRWKRIQRFSFTYDCALNVNTEQMMQHQMDCFSKASDNLSLTITTSVPKRLKLCTIQHQVSNIRSLTIRWRDILQAAEDFIKAQAYTCCEGLDLGLSSIWLWVESNRPTLSQVMNIYTCQNLLLQVCPVLL